MHAERQRILEMLHRGQLTVEQADRLLEALDHSYQAQGKAGAEPSRPPGDRARVVDWGGLFGRIFRDFFGPGKPFRPFKSASRGVDLGAEHPETRAADVHVGPSEVVEAVLMSEDPPHRWSELAIRCWAGHLELKRAEGDRFRVVACRPTSPGDTAPPSWEKDAHFSSQRNGPQQIMTIGDPDNAPATANLTFRFEIPIKAGVAAETERGNIAAAGLCGGLTLKTGAGDVAVEQIEGGIKANTAHGDLTAKSVEGELKLNSGSGNIAVKDVEGAVKANTGDGDVVTANIEGSVAANTGGGNVACNEIEGQVSANSGAGDIVLSSVEGRADANTGAGNIVCRDIEGELRANSGKGDVIVASTEGSVTVKTASGNLTIRDVQGEVVAETRAGDIILDGVGDKVSATTRKGRVITS